MKKILNTIQTIFKPGETEKNTNETDIYSQDTDTVKLKMLDQNRLFNRDISWLSFNYRVLEESKDKNLPLYERIKFLAIYSSNLDEFFRVRIAFYRSLLDFPASNNKKKRYNPEESLKKMNEIVRDHLAEFSMIFEEQILPELRENDIILYQDKDDKLSKIHEEFIDKYFYQEILMHLQPVLLEDGNVFSFLQDNVIYLAIRLYRKTKANKPLKRKPKHAIIKVPTHYCPRFIELPVIDNKYYIIFLDDIIKQKLHILFPGYVIDATYSIKLSRNADLLLDDEVQGDFVEQIRNSLSKRKTGAPCRFLFDKNMNQEFVRLLRRIFNLSKDDLVPGITYTNFSDFFGFPNPVSPNLEVKPMPPLKHPELEQYDSMFRAIRDSEWILHFPYQSYSYVIQFLNEAAVDPKVVEIKCTQYRVATNSAIVSSLISAARNGKKVTVFVEFQARFDEANNLKMSEEMKKAGIKIIPSIPGIKVHSKVALVWRKSTRDKMLRGYSFLSTGNFNEKTAKLYCDHGFFTYNQDIANDIEKMFTYFETREKNFKLKHLLLGQFNMRHEFMRLIDREIENVKKGGKGYMILKMNGLEEPKIIHKLYEASEQGVEIDLIARSVCCLIPDQSFSKNIRITRLVDRFLEHARVFVFYNNGENDMYMGSADWMKRNLYRRVESVVPLQKPEIKEEMLQILKIQLADNIKARFINEKLENVPKERKPNDPKVRAQIDTYEYLKEKYKHTEL